MKIYFVLHTILKQLLNLNIEQNRRNSIVFFYFLEYEEEIYNIYTPQHCTG